jgi:pyruvate/2-oxoglutarate dehydrogenase complex dihydrolipoamide dehydrogenase (E3) component
MSTDLIIIGGGTAGLGAAREAIAAGASPLLITDGPIGGDCTFTGCVPSKSLIADSHRGRPFPEAMARLHRVIEEIAATESADVLRGEGVEVIDGRGQLVGADAVEVHGVVRTAPHIVVATGARAAIPPIPGLDTVPYLTNETLFELTELPARLGVIGGGAIGSEMAMAFAGFGSTVTLVEGLDRILPHEEPEASSTIQRVMEAEGIDVLTGHHVDSVSAGPAGIELAIGDRTVTVDALLVATGRRPNTGGLGLEALGVALDDRGHVVVDGKLKTNVDGIRAAGDVTGLLPFTHAAYEQARLAVAHALKKGTRWKYDASTTPWVTFTRPEVARVGVTEHEAAEMGGRVAYLPLTHVDRALTEDRTEGFVKLIAGPKPVIRHAFGGQLIGATIVAERGGEMMHGPAMAARLGMFTGRLAQVTVAYPTWTMAVQQAAGQFFQKMHGLEARPAQRTK